MTPDSFGPRVRLIPEGDYRERLTCPDCGYIAYENPKMVAGSVVSVGGKIMLCRRAIEPRKGFWTLPAGFLELHETPEEGARREAWEEARARIAIDALLALGEPDRDPLLVRARRKILATQNRDGSWGRRADEPYTRLHKTWVALDGLTRYGRREIVSPRLPALPAARPRQRVRTAAPHV